MRTDIQQFTDYLILGLQEHIASEKANKDTKSKKVIAKKEILLAFLRNSNV